MKIFRVLIFAFFILKETFQFKTKHDDPQTVASRISELIDEIFVKYEIKFDLITFGDFSSHLNKVHNELRKFEIPLNIIQTSDQTRSEKIVFNSAIILCHSVDDLKKFFDFSLEEFAFSTPRRLRFLFYVEKPFNVSKFEVRPLDAYLGKISWYSYWLVNDKDKIHLQTIEWFTEQKCGKEQIITLNSFDKKLQKWQNLLSVPEKFKNYHNCTLNVASNVFPFGYLELIASFGQFIFPFPHIYEAMAKRDIIEKDFIQVFGQRGNYTVNYVGRNHLAPNLHIAQFILFFTQWFWSYHWGSVFYEETFMIFLSPPEEYSSYEKLILPFDKPTWFLLIASFVVAHITIFAADLGEQKFKKWIIGEGVTTPDLNVHAIFFGMSLTKLPSNNFARIILTTFIWVCLVLRTGYQGVYYEMITTDMRKPQPIKVDDLAPDAHNYTVYTAADNFNINEPMIESKQFLAAHPKVVLKPASLEDGNRLFVQLNDPTAKIGITADLDSYTAFGFKLFKEPPKILEEKLKVMKSVGTFFHNHAFWLIEDTMEILISAGIPQWHRKFIYKVLFKDVEASPKEPKVFSFESLKVGFVIWGSACGISLACFLMELIYFYAPKVLGNVFGLIALLGALENLLLS